MANLDKAREFVREHGAGFAVEAAVNFLGPLLVYDLTHRSLGDVGALIASSIPPTLWTLIEFARRRRVDAVSILVLAGIALSLLAFIGGGGARFLQLREKLVTALIGVIFLASAAIGKPLIYQLARAGLRRRGRSELESFEALKDNAHFRRSMTLMTVVWGLGLVIDAALASVLVFTLSIRAYMLAGPVLGYGVTGSLALWTFWYVRRQRRRGEARRAAEAPAAMAAAVAPERRLEGYDGRFGMKGWPASGQPRERSSEDRAALMAEAERLVAEGAFVRAEVSAWNFELNDWVRLATFGARTPRAES